MEFLELLDHHTLITSRLLDGTRCWQMEEGFPEEMELLGEADQSPLAATVVDSSIYCCTHQAVGSPSELEAAEAVEELEHQLAVRIGGHLLEGLQSHSATRIHEYGCADCVSDDVDEILAPSSLEDSGEEPEDC